MSWLTQSEAFSRLQKMPSAMNLLFEALLDFISKCVSGLSSN